MDNQKAEIERKKLKEAFEKEYGICQEYATPLLNDDFLDFLVLSLCEPYINDSLTNILEPINKKIDKTYKKTTIFPYYTKVYQFTFDFLLQECNNEANSANSLDNLDKKRQFLIKKIDSMRKILDELPHEFTQQRTGIEKQLNSIMYDVNANRVKYKNYNIIKLKALKILCNKIIDFSKELSSPFRIEEVEETKNNLETYINDHLRSSGYECNSLNQKYEDPTELLRNIFQENWGKCKDDTKKRKIIRRILLKKYALSLNDTWQDFFNKAEDNKNDFLAEKYQPDRKMGSLNPPESINIKKITFNQNDQIILKIKPHLAKYCLLLGRYLDRSGNRESIFFVSGSKYMPNPILSEIKNGGFVTIPNKDIKFMIVDEKITEEYLLFWLGEKPKFEWCPQAEDWPHKLNYQQELELNKFLEEKEKASDILRLSYTVI